MVMIIMVITLVYSIISRDGDDSACNGVSSASASGSSSSGGGSDSGSGGGIS